MIEAILATPTPEPCCPAERLPESRCWLWSGRPARQFPLSPKPSRFRRRRPMRAAGPPPLPRALEVSFRLTSGADKSRWHHETAHRPAEL